MTQFNISVSFTPVEIKLGISPRLENILLKLIDRDYRVDLSSEPAAPEEPKADEKPKEAPAAAPQPTKGGEPTNPQSNGESAPQAQETANPADLSKYDAPYCRKVMDRTRRRIEGENYLNETDSEGYKKYHKKLTGEFKRIAMDVSGGRAEKPSELEPAQIALFEGCCDALALDDAGALYQKLPF